MSDKPIPKPTIRNTPPTKPPVLSSDIGEPEVPEAPKEVEVKKEETLEKISTSEGIETDLVKRFLGAFVDIIIAGVLASIIGKLSGISFLTYLVWGLVMLTKDSLPFLEGQSLGKKVMKMKAVKEDGSSLSADWISGATRNILLAIPVAGVIECFILLTRSGNPGDGLRLGDDWAKTKVVSAE